VQKDYVSKEQVDKARVIGLLEYLERAEASNLVNSAPGEYRLKDHDSLKISNGKFNWFSQGVGGSNAIDFLVKVRGVSFQDAVRELSGDSYTLNYTEDKRAPPRNVKKDEPSPLFELPKANSHNNDAVEYLKSRGISENIINTCIEQQSLYQAVSYKKHLFYEVDGEKKPFYKVENGKNVHMYEVLKGGCVFVGYDSNKQPHFACERDTKSNHKKDITGSNKAYGFKLAPINGENSVASSQRLYVFEGVIDCLSHATIATIARNEGKDWDGHRLSLGGVSSLALQTFLESNTQVTNVYLCLDNDKAGIEATERISKELLENEKYKHLNVFIAPPPISAGKDYNEVLLHMVKNIKERELQNKRIMEPDKTNKQPKQKKYEASL
jgi:hypothetical protein